MREGPTAGQARVATPVTGHGRRHGMRADFSVLHTAWKVPRRARHLLTGVHPAQQVEPDAMRQRVLRDASSITFVTAPGRLTITACEASTSSVCALARLDMKRWRSGAIALSWRVIRLQEGTFR